MFIYSKFQESYNLRALQLIHLSEPNKKECAWGKHFWTQMQQVLVMISYWYTPFVNPHHFLAQLRTADNIWQDTVDKYHKIFCSTKFGAIISHLFSLLLFLPQF